MELFIQIKDGQPFEHPIFGDNFRQAFPDVDINNLPPEFARFERIQCPQLATLFQVDEVSYQWIDGIVKDVWTVREMTDQEKAQKMQDLSTSAIGTVNYMREVAQDNANNALTEAAKQAWLDYVGALNEWTLVDPVNPNIPAPPVISSDGIVVSLNASGTEPNVIG
jgi:hypothetical protein